MSKIFVVPRHGVRVRHPDTGKVLAPEGEAVERGSYWLRRAKDGDVTIQSEGRQDAAPTSNPSTWPSPPDDAAVAVEGGSFSEEKGEGKGKKRKSGVSNG
jgi:hypothetical protein